MDKLKTGQGFASIALVIVIVVIAGVAGYFVVRKSGPVAQQTPTVSASPTSTKSPTPTPKDETAGWKTYVNTKYGFELKYSPEIKLSEKPGQTWTTVILDKPSFRFMFFAGMREVGGYIGYGTVWAKKILIDGRMVDEALVKCEGNDVTLQIAFTKFDGVTRFDHFDSDCFDKSLIETFVPQMETIAKTLKYSK